MAELTPLEKFQLAVDVAKKNFEYDFFYAQDCWEVGFICPCMNDEYGEGVDGEIPECCEGYWFMDLHTPIPFTSWTDLVCESIAGEFTKWKYFDGCTCNDDWDDGEDETEEYEWDDDLSDAANERAEAKWDKDHPEKDMESAQEKFQKKVDKVFYKALEDAEKLKDELGYYPIKLNGKKGIAESEVEGYQAPTR